MDELILMKLNTVVVYYLRMCMKEDNSSQKNIKGDNYLCKKGVSFVIWLTVLVYEIK